MIAKDEFIESLQNALSYWGATTQAEVLSLLGQDAAVMVGYDQHNPHHCYTLFEHCLHAVDNLDRNASVELKVAAFFHDIGKPRVAAPKDGRLTFHGHAKASGIIAEPLLKQLGFNEEEQRRILFFIVHHDDFINYQLIKDKQKWHCAITDENIDRYKNKVMLQNPWLKERDLLELVRLCKADVSAQSEIVYMKGVFKDSKIKKLARIKAIKYFLFHEPKRIE